MKYLLKEITTTATTITDGKHYVNVWIFANYLNHHHQHHKIHDITIK